MVGGKSPSHGFGTANPPRPRKVRMENQTLQSNSSQTKSSNPFDLFKHLGIKRLLETPVIPPVHYDLLTPEETNQKLYEMAETVHHYMENLHHKHIVLTNPEEKKVSSKRASDSSRYTRPGLAKIQRKNRARLKRNRPKHGVLLTLTVAGCDANSKNYQGKDLLSAWKAASSEVGETLNELGKWRKRHGYTKKLQYHRQLEIQPGRFYPHNHIWFPDIKYLAPLDVIDKLWPYGITNVLYIDEGRGPDYVTDYISKMEGRDFFNVMLFNFHLRLYSNSQDLNQGPEIRKDTAWGYASAGTLLATERVIWEYLMAGYSEAGQASMMPRGP